MKRWMFWRWPEEIRQLKAAAKAKDARIAALQTTPLARLADHQGRQIKDLLAHLRGVYGAYSVMLPTYYKEQATLDAFLPVVRLAATHDEDGSPIDDYVRIRTMDFHLLVAALERLPRMELQKRCSLRVRVGDSKQWVSRAYSEEALTGIPLPEITQEMAEEFLRAMLAEFGTVPSR